MTLLLVLSVGAVYAAEPGEATFTEVDNGAFLNASADTLAATGGTIFSADVTTTASTVRWVGISGTASGNIVLGDSSANVLYNWGAADPIAVYATLAGDGITWASGLSNGVQGAFETDFGYLTVGNAPNDNYATTFDNGTVDLGATSNMFSPNACPSASTISNGGTDWKTLHCQDTDGKTVLVGLVQASNEDYAGNVVDYQMIIPEQGGQGNEAATQWDLWIELE